MEAARVLAERGHRVRLAERGPALGGMLTTAAAVHGRHRLGVAVDWWRRELARLDVTVSLGHEVSAAELDDAIAQGIRVLLATGSVPGPRDYRIAPGAHVVEAADLVALASSGALDQLPEGRAVVFDPIGGPVGVGVAELLAANGRPTSIVTQDQIAGSQLALTGDLAEANSRLQRAGVRRELRACCARRPAIMCCSRTGGPASSARRTAGSSCTAGTGCRMRPCTCIGRARCGPATAWLPGRYSRRCLRAAGRRW